MVVSRKILVVGVILVLLWVAGLVYVSLRFGIIQIPNRWSEEYKGTTVKRSYMVEKWSPSDGVLSLTKNESEKINVIVEAPRVKVILTEDMNGNDRIVSGADAYWEKLFCPGDRVLLSYKVIDKDNLELFEIRNNGERSCGDE